MEELYVRSVALPPDTRLPFCTNTDAVSRPTSADPGSPYSDGVLSSLRWRIDVQCHGVAPQTQNRNNTVVNTYA